MVAAARPTLQLWGRTQNDETLPSGKDGCGPPLTSACSHEPDIADDAEHGQTESPTG
jgi:hypothetical protein